MVHRKERKVHVFRAGKASVLSTIIRLCVSLPRLITIIPTLFTFAVTRTCISAVQILKRTLHRFVIEKFSTWFTDAESRSVHVTREQRVVTTTTSSLGVNIMKINKFFIVFSKQNKRILKVARTASISSWQYKYSST